jgi:FkbM family methyltransferase
MIKYYSQNKQDEYLWENYFKHKLTGTFVEIGAEDGVRFSNTKFLEESGWDGICIEPRPNAFAELKENRNCIVENYAISDKMGTFDFLSIEGNGKGLSGLVDKYDPRHTQRIKAQHSDSKQSIIQVECIPLNDLLEKHNITTVDYMSIDVEGAELNVVKSVDFEKYNVNIITIENNYQTNEVEQYLSKYNFKKVRSIGGDDLYEFIK